MSKLNKLEVLCPAGDFEAVVAAVQNGADAIYLGQKEFSARQNAKNFDNDDLREAVSYCHTRGVLIYLALNTLVFDTQLNSVVDAIKDACQLGIDAIIVQDLGILSLVREVCPQMRIHASTQMAVHTKKGAQFLYKQGVKRVVLARELTLEEIQDISQNVDIETEVFVHGALCMSVSGQCYMSAMIGGRSGNRGNCAGTCRLPFSNKEKVSSSSGQGYDLSLKDNCLAAHIDELKLAGVTSIKIEGRMKRPEYVAAAAKVYSDARNGNKPSIDTLKAVFSRTGFTDGYLVNKADSDMFGYRQKDDVISATSRILKDLANTYKKEVGRIPLNLHIKAVQNEDVTLTAYDTDGNIATASSIPPETAHKVPMTVESVSRSLSKLGGTPFILGELTAELGDGLIVPASVLNELRRCVCDDILSKREKIIPLPCSNTVPTLPQNNISVDKLKFRARFANATQIPFDMIDKLEYIILPVDEVSKNRMMLSPYKDKIIIEPYRIMFQCEEDLITKLSSLKAEGYKRILADNLAHIEIANQLGFIIHAGNYLNCVNSFSAKTLKDYGVQDITLSFEIELNKATKIKSELPLGLISYGYLPLMIMKNCPIKAKTPCKECSGKQSLTDRMDVKFRVVCNKNRYSEILNSSKLYMADRLHEYKGISFATLYFTTEDKLDCGLAIEDFFDNTPAFGQFTRGLYYRGV